MQHTIDLLEPHISNLRLMALLVGAAVFVIAFFYFRGSKWNKLNFALLAFSGLFLVLIGAFPETVNPLRDVLSLGDTQNGRILSLIILSVGLVFFLLLYTRAQLHRHRV